MLPPFKVVNPDPEDNCILTAYGLNKFKAKRIKLMIEEYEHEQIKSGETHSTVDRLINLIREHCDSELEFSIYMYLFGKEYGKNMVLDKLKERPLLKFMQMFPRDHEDLDNPSNSTR